jgi:CDP-glucose 4,6-dehydratase
VAQIVSGVPTPEFWNGRKVLVTGHTGFKGSWLTKWLEMLGADLCGVALDPNAKQSIWNDLRDNLKILDVREDIRGNAWQQKIDPFEPEIAFHLAAQPLVVMGWKDPESTFDTNLMGLVKFLQWVSSSNSLKTAIVITSDKVYKLDSTKKPKSESDPLGGDDPYSASKAAAELILHSWPLTPDKRLASARSGNVIGGGDWAEDRLIPDLIRHWQGEKQFESRNLNGIRPWQHVLEPICGYLLLAEKLTASNLHERAYNFGPSPLDQVTVKQIVFEVESHLGIKTSPSPMINSMKPKYKESEFLLLNSKLAETKLNWKSQIRWEQAIDMTVSWYKKYYQGMKAGELIAMDIKNFVEEVKLLQTK